MKTRRRIALLRTRATLEEVGADRLDLIDYHLSGRRVEPGGLIALVPEALEFADVEEHVFVSGGGEVGGRTSSLVANSVDLLDLRRQVCSLLGDRSIDGVVISHGTNSLEETAFFLWATLAGRKPVIVVGAMRPPSAMSADVSRNLWAALRVASADQVLGYGVLVVMNDTIFSAREVTKGHTSRLDAFNAGSLGPLGSVNLDGRVLLYHRPVLRADPALGSVLDLCTDLPRVDVLVSYLGSDGGLIDAAAELGCQGVVVAGRGGGQPTVQEWDAIDRLQRKGVVVCLASRVPSGQTVTRSDIPGGRLLHAGDLQAWKARLLLMAGLAMTDDPSRLRTLFEP